VPQDRRKIATRGTTSAAERTVLGENHELMTQDSAFGGFVILLKGRLRRLEMKRSLFLVVFCLTAVSTQMSACRSAVRPATTVPHYTTSATPIGVLLKDPAASAIIEKQIPGFTTADRVGMASGMTLRQVQRFRPNVVTDEKLAAMDEDFSKIPAH
jgi:hypothetical protein